MDRLEAAQAQSVYEALKDESVVNESAVSDMVVANPKSGIGRIDTTDLVQGSVKARRHRTFHEKRATVGFDESPPTVRRISPQPITRLPSGLVSYQRPAGKFRSRCLIHRAQSKNFVSFCKN